jgi:hypothetical protein
VFIVFTVCNRQSARQRDRFIVGLGSSIHAALGNSR